MILVLCMAGIYARFRRDGYTCPKYLLPLDAPYDPGSPPHSLASVTMLDAVLATMSDPAITEIYLLVNRRDALYAPDLLDVVHRSAHSKAQVLYTHDTHGQADTARTAVCRFGLQADSRPIVFHNIDTLLFGRDFAAIEACMTGPAALDGWIDTFSATGTQFSYVRATSEVTPQMDAPDLRLVAEMAEKRPISSYATSGLYAFRTPAVFLAGTTTSERSGGEFYISDVYAHLLTQGARIGFLLPQVDALTYILGTPDEYHTTRVAAYTKLSARSRLSNPSTLLPVSPP